MFEASYGRRSTALVWVGLGAAVFLDTAIQLCWKIAVYPAPLAAGFWNMILFTLNQPLFHITILLILLQFVNWMTVLAKTDLSYSQPITALSLISVTFFSRILLHEQIPKLRIMGMMLILTGIWLVTTTVHRTRSDALDSPPVNVVPEKAGE